MNRRLAKKVVELFRDDVRPDGLYFWKYSERDWRKTKVWLDSSGLALHFLAQLNTLGLTDSVPAAILAELEQNMNDRRLEVKQRVELFTDLIHTFQQHEIRFAVEKGIALVPEYCPELALRFQVDFDFLVHTEDVERCHDLLVSRGYRYIPTIEGERRFNKGDVGIPSMNAFYKPKQKYTVELHYGSSEETSAKLAGATIHDVGCVAFPVLSRVDSFLEYVLHFVKHLRYGWVRADALLEYRRFVRSVATNQSFWKEVQRRCTADAALQEANAIIAMLAQKVLGVKTAALQRFVDAAPEGLRCWIDRYAWSVLLAEYPGTKLHLILEFESGQRAWSSCVRGAFPTRCLPARIVESDSSAGSEHRQSFSAQALFFLFRCRYHLRESLRTTYELIAWSWTRRSTPEERRLAWQVSNT